METKTMYPVQAKELGRQGALYVTYDPSLRRGVAEAMEKWDAFCALPNDQKVHFGYSPDAKTSGNGYELQLEGRVDQKEDCHLRTMYRDLLMVESAKAHPEIGPAFVESALKVNALMAEVVRDFAAMVESEYHIPGFEQDVMAWQPRWLLRFLHYFPVQAAGEEIAAPHVDKGGFTLHLYESHPGVQYFSRDERKWLDLPLPHDQTVMFPGLGLQNRSRCQLRALTHRVVANEETAVTGRTSAVCFFNFDNARFYDKSTFGSTQKVIKNHGPDYFYDMPFERFDEFFID